MPIALTICRVGPCLQLAERLVTKSHAISREGSAVGISFEQFLVQSQCSGKAMQRQGLIAAFEKDPAALARGLFFSQGPGRARSVLRQSLRRPRSVRAPASLTPPRPAKEACDGGEEYENVKTAVPRGSLRVGRFRVLRHVRVIFAICHIFRYLHEHQKRQRLHRHRPKKATTLEVCRTFVSSRFDNARYEALAGDGSMEITNFSVEDTPLPSQPRVGTPRHPVLSDQATRLMCRRSSQYPTPRPAELRQLLDQVRAQPAVRADRVQAAVERLQQGYYHGQSSIAAGGPGDARRRMMSCSSDYLLAATPGRTAKLRAGTNDSASHGVHPRGTVPLQGTVILPLG